MSDPELLVTCWSKLGLGAQRPTLRRVPSNPSVQEVQCILCVGDVCERRSFRVQAQEGKPVLSTAPDARLVCRLLTQPLALLAVGGMALLAACCAFHSTPTDAILSLVGGRQWAWTIFYCACLAHAIEGGFAFVGCLRAPLRLSMPASLCWSCLVCVVGFPCLRFVLALRSAAAKEEGQGKAH